MLAYISIIESLSFSGLLASPNMSATPFFARPPKLTIARANGRADLGLQYIVRKTNRVWYTFGDDTFRSLILVLKFSDLA